jgi:hypothetical protein
MSETTETPPLDPVAFVAALILAPLLFTLLTFWVVLIPVAALFIGGLPYLILGTPVLLMMLLQGPCTMGRMALAGMFTIAITFALAVMGNIALGSKDLSEVIGLGLCSMIFAPLWAATFAKLYNRFYHHPAA